MAAIAVAGVLFGISAEYAYHLAGGSLADQLRDAAVGWAFLGAGLVAWRRQPASRIGHLMVAEGFIWFLGNFQSLPVPIVSGLSYWLTALNLGILAHLIVSYPSGRLTTRGARIAATSAYAWIGIAGFLDAAVYDPMVDGPAGYLCGARCPANGLLILSGHGLYPLIDSIYHAGGAALGAVVAVLIVLRWTRASGLERRTLMPVWASVALLLFAGAYNAWLAIDPQFPATTAGAVLTWLSDLSQLAIPLAFLFGLIRTQLARGAVGELVVELDQVLPPTRLRDALARTLGDRSLELAFWIPESEQYVSPDGTPLRLPGPESSRMVTLIEHQGQRRAAIIHDPAVTDDWRLLEAVRAAARLGLENDRLQAELRAHIEDLRASRLRVVEAADAERRRIERNLHDGAQQRLTSVALTLGLALERAPDDEGRQATLVRRALGELRLAVADIRELARGIHPAILEQEGLAAAVASLVEAAPVPVAVQLPPQRYPSQIESTAYYIISEAVANAIKHARATRIHVTAQEQDRLLAIDVIDDGVGGAGRRRGTGLQSLADRAATVGGTFHVGDRRGGGTRLRVHLPLTSDQGDESQC